MINKKSVQNFKKVQLSSLTVQKEWIVSLRGHDSSTCGNFLQPCPIMGYTLLYGTNTGDIITADNYDPFNKEAVFYVNKSFPIEKNLTIIGSNGRPILARQYSMFLFDDKELSQLAGISLNIINIWLKGVSLLLSHKLQDFATLLISK